jgi:integrase
MKRGTHVYRHSGATTYLRNHGNVKCLQELLGHENIKTTMKYVDAMGPAAMIEDHRLASPVDNLLGSFKPAYNRLPKTQKSPSP